MSGVCRARTTRDWARSFVIAQDWRLTQSIRNTSRSLVWGVASRSMSRPWILRLKREQAAAWLLAQRRARLGVSAAHLTNAVHLSSLSIGSARRDDSTTERA